MNGETWPKPDPRVSRTKSALTNAFNVLVLQRTYGTFTASDVAELAQVGRSTFYQHYTGLVDLLTQNLDVPLGHFARSSLSPDAAPTITQVLEHFWENRKVGVALLRGPARRVAEQRLIECFTVAILDQWPPAARMADGAAIVAIQLAAGHLAVLEAWMAGRLAGSAGVIGTALSASSFAAATARFGSEPSQSKPSSS